MGLCSSIKMVANPLDDMKQTPQPQTKKALRSMIKNYDGGKKSYGEPNTWDVTRVTDMSKLFQDMTKFNAPIDQWNTSQVTNMRFMFCDASSFNQPITMDTSNVTKMYKMFNGASSFNQPLTMDTSKVTKMYDMFKGADAMTHPLPQTKEMIAVSNFFLKVLRGSKSKVDL